VQRIRACHVSSSRLMVQTNAGAGRHKAAYNDETVHEAHLEISPGSLATNGIYSQKDLKDLRNHIMFPAERLALLNTIARGIMGQTISINGGSISNLFDEATIEKIAATAWDKFWNKFLIFGNISAGFIGIYLLLRSCKLILDTVVHGYALHTVYGWSVYLIGALCDSLTHLLLHLGTRKNTEKN